MLQVPQMIQAQRDNCRIGNHRKGFEQFSYAGHLFGSRE
jgi:hypothetical protein